MPEQFSPTRIQPPVQKCAWCPAETTDGASWRDKYFCKSCWAWWNEKKQPPQLRLRVIHREQLRRCDRSRPKPCSSSPDHQDTVESVSSWPIGLGEIILLPGYYEDADARDCFDLLVSAQTESRISEGNPVIPWSCHHKLDLDKLENSKSADNRSKPAAMEMLEALFRDWERRFDVRVLEKRVNFYKDSDYKPFHQDSHCVHEPTGIQEEITIAATFGAARDVAFRPLRSSSGVTTGRSALHNNQDLFNLNLLQNNGDVLIFDTVVNKVLEHGVPDLRVAGVDNEVPTAVDASTSPFTRISVVAWCARNSTVRSTRGHGDPCCR
ncbi:unnamed protein product [Amoebophrya sp. A120]|nr:unnamed protein product [Amoebophrya sp. A120]|eukprot:GSA120T00010933001.1